VDGQTATFSGTNLPTWNTTDPSISLSGGVSLNSFLNAGTDLNFDQLTPNKMTVVAKVFVNVLNVYLRCIKCISLVCRSYHRDQRTKWVIHLVFGNQR
jgi:hypothetical protein